LVAIRAATLNSTTVFLCVLGQAIGTLVNVLALR
jgi:hypothetical protein